MLFAFLRFQEVYSSLRAVVRHKLEEWHAAASQVTDKLSDLKQHPSTELGNTTEKDESSSELRTLRAELAAQRELLQSILQHVGGKAHPNA